MSINRKTIPERHRRLLDLTLKPTLAALQNEVNKGSKRTSEAAQHKALKFGRCPTERPKFDVGQRVWMLQRDPSNQPFAAGVKFGPFRPAGRKIGLLSYNISQISAVVFFNHWQYREIPSQPRTPRKSDVIATHIIKPIPW